MSVLMVQSALRFTPPARPQSGKPVRLQPGRCGFRFTEIATAKPRWDLFGASAVFQSTLLFLLGWLPILYVRGPQPVRYTLTMMTRPLIEYEPPQRKPIAMPRVERKPMAPVEQAVKPALAMETRIVAPKVSRREVRPVDVPQMNSPIRAAELSIAERPSNVPRPPVVTGVLASPGTSEQPTLTNKRVDQVETGGFGDPNGVPAKGDPNKAANINRAGSFGLPPGHGYGNGTGGTKGARGVVESAGFGNGVSKGDPNPRSSPGRGGVQSTSFGDAAPSAGNAGAPSGAALRTAKAERVPVEILHKPNPAYTDRARQLRIEGNVKLRVVFAASGELRILGVTHGLGYGLDEAAVAAAQKIRFRPAREDGRPVDEPASVTIEFKLAF